MKKTTPAVAFGIMLAATGCFGKDRQGHLYTVPSAAQGSVVLHTAPAPRGSAEAVLPSGEACTGEFATVPNDAQRALEDNRIIEEHTQTGTLVLSCKNGQLIKCEFSRDPWAGGAGTCRDTRGVEYNLVF